ncbi:hypothetical protein MSPP1_000811 [Malassezia sp. CBS 17886]|nr:hypothetical protein MSPP1_000811 [Malassezia sp. CBS 17886]
MSVHDLEDLSPPPSVHSLRARFERNAQSQGGDAASSSATPRRATRDTWTAGETDTEADDALAGTNQNLCERPQRKSEEEAATRNSDTEAHSGATEAAQRNVRPTPPSKPTRIPSRTQSADDTKDALLAQPTTGAEESAEEGAGYASEASAPQAAQGRAAVMPCRQLDGAPGNAQSLTDMSAVERRYSACFLSVCTPGQNTANGASVAHVWRRSKLPDTELGAVWTSVGDSPNAETLTQKQFCTGLGMIDAKLRVTHNSNTPHARVPPPGLPPRPVT